ncbi:DMT family transporter [Pseudomonas sp. DC3000-4b1]|uniref:DMT family transporter n=1 Tax=unclassified Pseudomonas TaxID=196821 RepID=UPI003CF97275
MGISRSSWAATAAMALFVLLWGSAAIFTRWGLDHGSPIALLILRFGLALLALALIGGWRRRWLPDPGTGKRVAATGFLLIGGYSVCYFQAMAHGMTPGLIATLLGVQPILTLLILERRASPVRLAGLLLALGGLVLVVYQSLVAARVSGPGCVFALLALAFMTFGALLQRQVNQHPAQVLPLQYVVSLLLCLALASFQPVTARWEVGLLVPVLWLGLVVSVVAQLLLYRLIQTGNLVKVTSLFYLVPLVTVLLDYLVLGNVLSRLGLLGMGLILLGLALVFRQHA